MQPPLDIGKGFPISDIVYHDDTVGPPVVCARYSSEPLLARRIPYLKLYSFTIYLQSPYFEVNTYRCNVTTGECVVGESKEQTALTYTCNIRSQLR